MNPSSNRPRRPLVAVVLAILAVPLGMLYVGRPLRAGVYLVLSIFSVLIAYSLAAAALWPAGVSWVVLGYTVAVAGIVDAWRIASRYREGFDGGWYTTWKGLGGVAMAGVAAILLFRAMVFEPFRVPSIAMLPTLHRGDYILVSKFAYGLRLPFLSAPVAFRRGPVPGDVIVLRIEAADVNYVKRVIGLPGDVVEYNAAGRRLTINGDPVPIEPLGPYEADESIRMMHETLGNRGYSILAMRDRPPARGGTFSVPEGHYFVLGDNRDNSIDSRFPNVGYVPREAVIGRVELVWWNTGEPARAGTLL